MGNLELDLAKAMNQADELERIARRLREISQNNMYNTMQNMSNNWKGESATKFYQKGMRVASDVGGTAANLQEAASTIRQIARRTYESEKRIQEIALKRTYKG